MTERTHAANDYVAAERQKPDAHSFATWFDVAAAYDAGLKHGFYRKDNARFHLEDLRDRERGSVTPQSEKP